jgi:hypothetical protein
VHRRVVGAYRLYQTSGRKYESISISRFGWRDRGSLIPESLQYFSCVFATCSTMLQVMLTTLYSQSGELVSFYTQTRPNVQTWQYCWSIHGGWTSSSSSRFFQGTRYKNLGAERKTRILMCKKINRNLLSPSVVR